MATERLEDDRGCSNEWRPIKGFEGFYVVSNVGDVKRIAGGRGARSGYVQRCPVNRGIGYRRATLVVGGIQTQRLVHVLVAAAFIGVRPSGLCINHIDGNKLNNDYRNLEYITLAANNHHAKRIGLTARKITHCINGHEYTSANTITNTKGSRQCRECTRIHHREYKLRKRLARTSCSCAERG